MNEPVALLAVADDDLILYELCLATTTMYTAIKRLHGIVRTRALPDVDVCSCTFVINLLLLSIDAQ